MPNIYASLTVIASQDQELVQDYLFTEATPNMYAAMSHPGSCMAMVHREEPLNATLNSGSDGSASYTFSSDIDFMGPVYVVIQAPILVNQCSIEVDVNGAAAGGGKKRFIVPSAADRVGSMVDSGGALTNHILDEGVEKIKIDFGSQGSGFDSGGKSPLDQNEGDDRAAYYGDYSRPASLNPHRSPSLVRLLSRRLHTMRL